LPTETRSVLPHQTSDADEATEVLSDYWLTSHSRWLRGVAVYVCVRVCVCVCVGLCLCACVRVCVLGYEGALRRLGWGGGGVCWEVYWQLPTPSTACLLVLHGRVHFIFHHSDIRPETRPDSHVCHQLRFSGSSGPCQASLRVIHFRSMNIPGFTGQRFWTGVSSLQVSPKYLQNKNMLLRYITIT
jgi:hypothetical protein